MSAVYTKRGSLSVKKEATANTAVIPNVFLEFNEENISTEFGYTPSAPVAGNRASITGAVDNKIMAPNGTINLNVEPIAFGNLLNSMGGSLTTGRFLGLTSVTGTFTVGETVTGGTSSNTAVVTFVGADYILTAAPSGALTDGETLTGGTSAATGVLTDYVSTAYGHAFNMPLEMDLTLSLQVNYSEHAIRYMGVQITGLDALGQSDNVITAGLKIMAQSFFRHAKVTAVTSSGAGAKTLYVDQVQGLVATDSIKVFRPSTGAFLDFSTTSVKTHTVGSVDATNFTIAVTNLETALAVGDLIMLAPQTATYTVGDEFKFVGGTQLSVGALLSSVASKPIEEFTLVVANEFEERHSAQGVGFATRYPSALLQKGLSVTGSFMAHYIDESFMGTLRTNTAQAVRIKALGSLLTGATSLRQQFRVELPEVRFQTFDTPITNDDIVDNDIPFEALYNTTAGYMAQFLLVNETSSY